MKNIGRVVLLGVHILVSLFAVSPNFASAVHPLNAVLLQVKKGYSIPVGLVNNDTFARFVKKLLLMIICDYNYYFPVFRYVYGA